MTRNCFSCRSSAHGQNWPRFRNNRVLFSSFVRPQRMRKGRDYSATSPLHQWKEISNVEGKPCDPGSAHPSWPGRGADPFARLRPRPARAMPCHATPSATPHACTSPPAHPCLAPPQSSQTTHDICRLTEAAGAALCGGNRLGGGVRRERGCIGGCAVSPNFAVIEAEIEPWHRSRCHTPPEGDWLFDWIFQKKKKGGSHNPLVFRAVFGLQFP